MNLKKDSTKYRGYTNKKLEHIEERLTKLETLRNQLKNLKIPLKIIIQKIILNFFLLISI